MPLRCGQLHGAVARGGVPLSGAYPATRNMVKVKQSVAQLPLGEWHAAVLEVEHQGEAEQLKGSLAMSDVP